MARTVTATEARAHLGAIMRRVRDTDEVVTVELGGKPQVVMLSIDEYRRLVAARPQEADWRTLLDEAHEYLREQYGDRELTPAEEIIRQVREERDAESVRHALPWVRLLQ
jgi:prevent-host-death family protein